ncbi:hypothetical protein F5Y19DRAFT_469675 [Xylariaceae sp. FL1651]|nr:hypothetical protein F5Y19DRAFT_469675 [Xylariaceae sp. FL1651]
MASFYEQRMLRLFERYEMSGNARTMLKAFDDFKTAKIDEASLGRLIRLSPNNRAALVSTMVKCANIMKDTPKESKYCLTIITSCGEMLEIAHNQPQACGFHAFAKLPREIRDRIYSFYLKNHRDADIVVIPYPKKGSCSCARHEPPQYESFSKLQIDLAYTSKAVSAEVLACFYRRRVFHFPCACEMDHHLTYNTLLKSTASRVMFHWTGERADSGIRQLQKMKQLEALIVIVSKSTSKTLTRRETEVRRYFGNKRGTNTIPESLGWEELLEIRGLKRVEVEHINKRKADRRTDDERMSLENILVSRLLLPRDADAGDNP